MLVSKISSRAVAGNECGLADDKGDDLRTCVGGRKPLGWTAPAAPQEKGRRAIGDADRHGRTAAVSIQLEEHSG
jgi:hypothetical protein